MWHKLIVIVSVLVVAAGFVLWDQMRSPRVVKISSNPAAEQGIRGSAPNFQIPVFGQENDLPVLEDFIGKTVILKFWATWCAICVAEMPKTVAMAADNSEKLVFIGVSVDAKGDNLQRYLDGLAPEMRAHLGSHAAMIAHDPDKIIAQDLYQTYMYPETYVIGPDGTIIEKFAGAKYNDDRFFTLIQTQLRQAK